MSESSAAPRAIAAPLIDDERVLEPLKPAKR
jgi:hypothetical protein